MKRKSQPGAPAGKRPHAARACNSDWHHRLAHSCWRWCLTRPPRPPTNNGSRVSSRRTSPRTS